MGKGKTALLAVLFVTASFLLLASSLDNRPSSHIKQRDGLSKEEERVLQNITQSKGLPTAFPTTGRWAFATILIVPEQLERIYEQHPTATLQFLEQILENGTPREAILADGCFHTLRGLPILGAFRVGEDPNGFDRKNPLTGKSPREYSIMAVKKDLTEQLLEPVPPPARGQR